MTSLSKEIPPSIPLPEVKASKDSEPAKIEKPEDTTNGFWDEPPPEPTKIDDAFETLRPTPQTSQPSPAEPLSTTHPTEKDSDPQNKSQAITEAEQILEKSTEILSALSQQDQTKKTATIQKPLTLGKLPEETLSKEEKIPAKEKTPATIQKLPTLEKLPVATLSKEEKIPAKEETPATIQKLPTLEKLPVATLSKEEKIPAKEETPATIQEPLTLEKLPVATLSKEEKIPAKEETPATIQEPLTLEKLPVATLSKEEKIPAKEETPATIQEPLTLKKLPAATEEEKLPTLEKQKPEEIVAETEITADTSNGFGPPTAEPLPATPLIQKDSDPQIKAQAQAEKTLVESTKILSTIYKQDQTEPPAKIGKPFPLKEHLSKITPKAIPEAIPEATVLPAQPTPEIKLPKIDPPKIEPPEVIKPVLTSPTITPPIDKKTPPTPPTPPRAQRTPKNPRSRKTTRHPPDTNPSRIAS